MATYTYDDFLKAAQNSGFTFSDADMELAKRNPDAGMSLLKYKTDFYGATTDEARALAHQGAENIRSQYGGYTGGGDGGSFALLDFSHGYGAGSKPTYENRYDDQTQELINAILNREPFSYDAENDPLFQQYRKSYTREGQRATEDAIGAAAAASGGIPSSYAATAATQAGNYYAAQMNDKMQETYQLAYDKFLNDYQMQQNDLSMLQNAEQIDYTKYLNSLGQYNTDRNFGYTQYLNNLAREDQQRQEALNFAGIAYGLGDASYYKNMGIDMSNDPAVYQRAMEIYAQTGNKSFLEALGITVPATLVTGSGGSSSRGDKEVSTTAPEVLTTAWIKQNYGTEINAKELKEIQAIYPEVTEEYLAKRGITVKGVNTGTVLPPSSTVTNTNPTTQPSLPAGSPVWTPDSGELGFDQSSVTIIGKRLGVGDISSEMLNDLIDAGIVEHYVANNQDRFRLVDNWETLWELYKNKTIGTNKTGGNSGGRTPNVTNTQK